MNEMFFEELANRAGWSVLHTLWQGTVLVLVAVTILPMVRSAAARHNVCLFAMVGMLALAAANWMRTPPERLGPAAMGLELGAESSATEVLAPIAGSVIGAAEPTTVDEAGKSCASDEIATARGSSSPSIPAGSDPSALAAASWEDFVQPLVPWFAWAWFLGVLLLSLRHLGGWWCIRWWRTHHVAEATGAIERTAESLRERLGILGDVRVLLSTKVATPILAGVIKPVILLPAALVNGVKRAEIEAILAHELAHWRRHDGWFAMLQAVIETLVFYHPGVWWIGSRVRQERENAADDLAVGFGIDRGAYIGALATLAEWQAGFAESRAAVAASGGSVLSRLRRLGGGAEHRPALTEWATGLAGLATVVVAGTLCVGLMTGGSAQEESGTRIDVQPGDSIQAAIDSAPAGATIVLPEGSYPERITIDKPITLEGAGWDKTLLKPDNNGVENLP
jgi:bla regulator protein BlaR1